MKPSNILNDEEIGNELLEELPDDYNADTEIEDYDEEVHIEQAVNAINNFDAIFQRGISGRLGKAFLLM